MKIYKSKCSIGFVCSLLRILGRNDGGGSRQGEDQRARQVHEGQPQDGSGGGLYIE